jgi:hypothetical protein
MRATARVFLSRIATVFVALLFAAMAGGCATAQSQPQPRGWSGAELDRLLAPVALYPDALLAQLLIAATYPDEIVTAARWSRMHPELAGEDAVHAADAFDWDPSVKSLLAFPGLIQRMDENIDWTRELGDAFLAQEQDVMDAVQDLRRRARVAGALASDARVHVAEDGPRIHIVFASPAVVYLPYDDPRVVYGRWWWPAHPPVVWAPWPGYRFVPRAPGVHIGFWWSSSVRLSVGFFYSDIDWPRREVRVVRVDTWYVHRAIERRAPHRSVVIRPGRWHHESTRRTTARRLAPLPAQVVGRPAAPRDLRRAEDRRPEARRPEPRQPEVRRPESRSPEVARPEPRRPEARESAPSAAETKSQREMRRAEAQHAPPREIQPRSSESARATSQRAPQRETRRQEPQREMRRAEAQHTPPREIQPRSSESARATSQRAPQRDARRQEPQRERQPAERQRGGTQQTEAEPDAPTQPRAQRAERSAPRPAPGPRNVDDAGARQPQG